MVSSTPNKIILAHLVLCVLLCSLLPVIGRPTGSVVCGYLIGLITYFLFYCCVLLQKGAKSALQKLVWLYISEVTKILFFVLFFCVALLTDFFYPYGLAVGTTLFFVVHVVSTIVFALKEARLV